MSHLFLVLSSTSACSSSSEVVQRPVLNEYGKALAAEYVHGERIHWANRKDDRVDCNRDGRMDCYTAMLLELHTGSLELEAQGDALVVAARSTNSLVEHLSLGVFFEHNTVCVDKDSVKNPENITRMDSHDVARHMLGLLELDSDNPRTTTHITGHHRVAVAVHPEIGKTLLHAVVARRGGDERR